MNPIDAIVNRLLVGVHRKLDYIITQLTQERKIFMATAQQVKDAADAALAAITNESSKDDSIIALVTANNTQIADLKAQLATAIAALPSGTDTALLDAALASLNAAQAGALANSAKVLAAVNANTTTAPPVVNPTPGATVS